MKINSLLGIFQRLWRNLKVLFIVFKKKLEETGSCEAKKTPDRPRKTTAKKTDGLVMNQKRID